MRNKEIKSAVYDFLSMFFIIVGNYLIYSTLAQMIKIVICTSFIVLGSIMTLIPVIKKFKNKEYTKKQLITVGLIALFAIPVWHRPAEIYVSTLLALRYVNEDLRRMIKNIFFASVISYAVIVLMWGIGVTIGVIAYRGDFLRHGIGFNHPNVAIRFLVPIIISGAIFCKNNRLFLFLSLAAAVCGFFVTNSRGGCLAIVIFCALSLLPRGAKKVFSNVKLVPILFLVFTIVSLVLVNYYNNNSILNELLSSRPYIWKVYMDNLKVIGQVYQVHDMPLDNVFLHTLYYGGVYGYVFYLIIYFVAFSKSGFKHNYNVFILFLTVFIYGLVENYSNQGESFYLLLVMIQLLDYKKLKELDDECEIEGVKEKEVEFIEEKI